jgi:diadenosine tetraphosphate (Ap4A) HIT family hydrolase
MSDLPPLVHETTSAVSSTSERDFAPTCPFCAISKSYSPMSPLSAGHAANAHLDPEKLEPPSYVLYSSDHIVAFPDIMPLTRGHVLVAPRKHRVKVGDLSPDEGAEVRQIREILWKLPLSIRFRHDSSRDFSLIPRAVMLSMHTHLHRLAEFSPFWSGQY